MSLLLADPRFSNQSTWLPGTILGGLLVAAIATTIHALSV